MLTAGRVTVRHRRSSLSRSSLAARTPACSEKPLARASPRSNSPAFCPYLKKSFANTNAPWAEAGEWTKPTIEVKGQWEYLYRAVDKAGKTVVFC